MLREFRAFVMRGNVLDLAVAVIIGAAFGAIINSLVRDILTPILGLLIGRVDFTNLFINLSGGSYVTLAEAQAAGAVTVNIGLFLNAVINFLIIAFAIFLVVRQATRPTRQPEAPPAEPTSRDCPYCFTTISIKATRCPHCTSELATA